MEAILTFSPGDSFSIWLANRPGCRQTKGARPSGVSPRDLTDHPAGRLTNTAPEVYNLGVYDREITVSLFGADYVSEKERTGNYLDHADGSVLSFRKL